MATNYAYYLGATGTAVATYKISSVTNNGDQNVVYNADGTLGILTAGATMEGSWDNVEILQTYNGTSDRPIKAGDEVTITYDYSENTVDGTTTVSYKTATFNVIYSNGAYILEYVEGTSFEGSYIESSTEGEEPSVIEETEVPLTEEEVTTLKDALNIYQNSSGELFIYADDSIDLSEVSRTSTADGSSLTWNDSAINNSGKTQTVELIGLGNNALSSAYKDKVFSFTVEGTQATVSTCFNNASTYFDIYENWEMNSGEDVTSDNYGQLGAKSYTGIILMNDIFMPNANIALGFNIFGNGHAIISSLSGEDNLFGTIGNTENEITIKDLAFVGATKSKISSGFSENATINFVNTDFYGTVYNDINDNTLGLNGISGTNINIYTAIYGKNGVNSKAAATYRGVVFAGDGQNYGDDGGDIALDQATLSETVGENTVNTFIAIKAGDAGNGGLTLSSGLPLATS